MDKNLHNSGLNRKKYAEMQKRTEDDLKKEVTDEATKRVTAALLLRDVIGTYGIKVSQIEIIFSSTKIVWFFTGVGLVWFTLPQKTRKGNTNLP